MPEVNCAAVDIFCGIGGLTHGFIKEGIPVKAGFDVDETCRYAYEYNNEGAQFIHRDLVHDDISKEVQSLLSGSDVKILVGCAPCQPFSSYSNTKTEKGSKWQLVQEFARLIEEVEPDLVSMENVTRLRSFEEGKVFDDFVACLKGIGHHVYSENVYCPDYGIPQTRRRLVLLSSRFGPIEMIPPTHEPTEYRTAEDQIGDLPEISCGETDSVDRYHKSSNLSKLNRRRIRASRPGGTWEDWDEELLAACHKRESGKSYKSVYGRIEKNEPAPTITTQFYSFGRGRFGHWEQDRALSLREGAMLQTFPRSYEFVEPDKPVYFQHFGRHIGNAVPVSLACAIASSMKKHMSNV